MQTIYDSFDEAARASWQFAHQLGQGWETSVAPVGTGARYCIGATKDHVRLRPWKHEGAVWYTASVHGMSGLGDGVTAAEALHALQLDLMRIGNGILDKAHVVGGFIEELADWDGGNGKKEDK